MNNEFLVNQFYQNNVKDAIKQALDPKIATNNQKDKVIVRYITPDQEIERIDSFDTYKGYGYEAEQQRRTANWKYPTSLMLDNGYAHIQYAILNDSSFVALKLIVAKEKSKDTVYIFGKDTILEWKSFRDGTTNASDFFARLLNSYLVYNDTLGKWEEIEKKNIEEYELIAGEDKVKPIMVRAKILIEENNVKKSPK